MIDFYHLKLEENKEYRYTIPRRYPMSSIGFSDRTARQGYYLTATDEGIREAIMKSPNEFIELEIGKNKVEIVHLTATWLFKKNAN